MRQELTATESALSIRPSTTSKKVVQEEQPAVAVNNLKREKEEIEALSSYQWCRNRLTESKDEYAAVKKELGA